MARFSVWESFKQCFPKYAYTHHNRWTVFESGLKGLEHSLFDSPHTTPAFFCSVALEAPQDSSVL